MPVRWDRGFCAESQRAGPGGGASALRGSERRVLGTAALTVGITDTLIMVKAEVSYGDRELRVEEKALCHRSTSVL